MVGEGEQVGGPLADVVIRRRAACTPSLSVSTGSGELHVTNDSSCSRTDHPFVRLAFRSRSKRAVLPSSTRLITATCGARKP